MTDADDREVLEYDGATGAIQRWYAYGPGPNDVLGQMNVPANTRTTFVPDLLGSVVATMASSTGTLTKFAYRPYGASASPATPFGFTGQRFDAESGLYYSRARMYSPAWGRFTQSDPIGYSAGTNLYAYVANDPLNGFDPRGLWTLQVGGAYTFTLGTWGFSIGGGFAVDLRGNAGVYGTVSAGPGVGGSTTLSAVGAISNAPTIMDLNGYGAGVSGQAGVVGAIGVGWQKGYLGNFEPYQSGSLSLGIGGGLGLSAGPSYTVVNPIVNWESGSAAPLSSDSQALRVGAPSYADASTPTSYGIGSGNLMSMPEGIQVPLPSSSAGWSPSMRSGK